LKPAFDQDLNPLRSLAHSLTLLLQRRVHFPRGRVGQRVELDGEAWLIFREVVVDPCPGQPLQPGANFQPRFHLRGMSARANMLISWLPVPFFIGLPGFRSKLWLYSPETGDFSGWYTWDRAEDAQRYSQSFAAKFMARRSVPGSVSFRVIAVE
jgi:hypothetical protein